MEKSGISNIYIPDGNSGGAKGNTSLVQEGAEINPDTVGYLKIDGTAIDYPVVKGKDNDYYLTHDFYGEKSKKRFCNDGLQLCGFSDGNSKTIWFLRS